MHQNFAHSTESKSKKKKTGVREQGVNKREKKVGEIGSNTGER